MYIPSAMKMASINQAHDLIREYSFGAIISESMEASHLPFILNENEGEMGTLYCHFARANPQWRQLENKEALVIFNGPHAYISPTWYASKPAVPTWNYAAAHIYGQVEILTGSQAIKVLDDTVGKYEPELLANDEMMPTNYKEKLVKAIIGVKITITRFDGKLKLGQHRKAEDQQGVVRGLSSKLDLDSRALLKFMISSNIALGKG